MELWLSVQTFVFLEALLLGIFLALVYDFFRCIRINLKAKIFLCAIMDFLFFLILIISFFMFIVSRSQGDLRFFIIIAMFCGFVLYFLTVSPYFRKLFDSFISILSVFFNILKKVSGNIYNFLNSTLKKFKASTKKIKFISRPKKDKILKTKVKKDRNLRAKNKTKKDKRLNSKKQSKKY